MKFYPPDARTCFIHGPVGVYIHGTANEAELRAAWAQIGRYLEVFIKETCNAPKRVQGSVQCDGEGSPGATGGQGE